jgi:endonuclease/exonuclease/phosphatase family metal-dependent hydrolase
MPTPLRLMTLNLGTGSGDPYVDFTVQAHVRYINRVCPDVVFLQEVDRGTQRAGGVDQLAVLRESTALSSSHFVKGRNLEGGEFGVGIISRFPLENAQNLSVYKPAHWWPFFVEQIIAPVAYAEINLAGTRVRLYCTHLHTDEGRKKFGADGIAAAIPSNVPLVLGGDFNDGPGGAAMAAIDAKVTYAEFISRRPPVYDLRFEEHRIDQICVSGGIACDTWTTESAVELPRGRFSDHPALFADLLVPVPPVWAGRCDEIESRTRVLLNQISRLERQRDLLEGQVGEPPDPEIQARIEEINQQISDRRDEIDNLHAEGVSLGCW